MPARSWAGRCKLSRGVGWIGDPFGPAGRSGLARRGAWAVLGRVAAVHVGSWSGSVALATVGLQDLGVGGVGGGLGGPLGGPPRATDSGNVGIERIAARADGRRPLRPARRRAGPRICGPARRGPAVGVVGGRGSWSRRVDQGHSHGSRANARGKEIQPRAFALDRRKWAGARAARGRRGGGGAARARCGRGAGRRGHGPARGRGAVRRWGWGLGGPTASPDPNRSRSRGAAALARASRRLRP
jgi:hypothetical protein